MRTARLKGSLDWKFETADSDEPSGPGLDLEAWLADLLIDYWLSLGEQNGPE